MQSHDMVSLVFLDASEVLYFHKTEDPWFSATTPTIDEDDPDNAYTADESASVLGCATKRLVCNPNMPKSLGCIDTFAGSESINKSFNAAWPNVQDQHVILPIIHSINEPGQGVAEDFYSVTGVPTLLSRNTMMSNYQLAKLPSNRWQSELEHIYRAALAATQSSVVEYARGYWYGSSACQAEFPCQRICHSQVSCASACSRLLLTYTKEGPFFEILFF